MLEGWVSHVEGKTGVLGVYLTGPARVAMGGANRVEVRRDGVLALDLPLARTSSRDRLDACLPRPKDENSAEE